MAKPGPKTKDNLSDLHDIFNEREDEIIDHDGKLRAPSDRIWSVLKRQHKIAKSEKALYNDCWRWNNCRQYRKEPSCDISGGSDEFFDESFNSLSELSLNDSDYENDEKKDNQQKMAFSITLTSSVWKTIEPVPRKYERAADQMHKKGKRVYLSLQPGAWTSLLADKIAEHTKNIVCDWSFKRARVTEKGRHYIAICAKCVTCRSSLIGFLQNKPEQNENVVFKFAVIGFDETKHEHTQKKVKVTGSKAKSLATSTKSAVVEHRKLSAKAGEMFEAARGRVPSAHAIRNLQYRQRQKNKLSSDVFKALFYLQNAPNYANIIQSIGFSPFYVIYGSPRQFALYNMYLKRNNASKLSCDATGGLARKIGKYNSMYKSLCLRE